MKYQVLFSLRNNEIVFIDVVCCSHDWHFKGMFLEVRMYRSFANLFSNFRKAFFTRK